MDDKRIILRGNVMGFECIEFECIDWVESIVEDLLEKYKNQKTYTDCEEYRREGAIDALEEVLSIVNGN